MRIGSRVVQGLGLQVGACLRLRPLQGLGLGVVYGLGFGAGIGVKVECIFKPFLWLLRLVLGIVFSGLGTRMAQGMARFDVRGLRGKPQHRQLRPQTTILLEDKIT